MRTLLNFVRIHMQGIKALAYLILLVVVIAVSLPQYEGDVTSFVLDRLIDATVLPAFLMVFLLNLLFDRIETELNRRYEESTKLASSGERIEHVIARYPLNASALVTDDCEPSPAPHRFPGLLLYPPTMADLRALAAAGTTPTLGSLRVLDDSQRRYVPPPYIVHFQADLLAAHRSSVTYNNLNIRLDGVRADADGAGIGLVTSRTTYVSSLLTNRATDYVLPNGLSLREMYEPGPYLTELAHSLFSNHLGFNLFIVSADDKVVLVQRSMRVSIHKGMLGPSVAASLKAKYALDGEGRFTIPGLVHGIAAEAKDELNFPDEAHGLEDWLRVDGTMTLVAIYRDLIEAGRPQLVLVGRSPKTFAQISARFQDGVRRIDAVSGSGKAGAERASVVMDGKRLVGLTLAQARTLSHQWMTASDQCDREHAMSAPHATALTLVLQHLDASATYSNEGGNA